MFSSQLHIVKASGAFNRDGSELRVEALQKTKLSKEMIVQLKTACVEAAKIPSSHRLRKLSNQLMHSFQVTASFELEMQRAELLLDCKAPSNAQKVLQGINPTSLKEQKAWSILFWKASNAVMDHLNASLALRRLSGGNFQTLDDEQITVGYGVDGTPLTRSALDLLAEHERLNGRCDAAAKVLLAGRTSGAIGARRISRAVQCLDGLSLEKRKALLRSALDEAKNDEAWWLVGDILRLHLLLDLASGGDAENARKRLEQFSKELDDRYTQLELIRLAPSRKEEKHILEDQLRSPRRNAPNLE